MSSTQGFGGGFSTNLGNDGFGSGFSYSKPRITYLPGLKADRYTQGYFADDMTWFDDKVPTSTTYPTSVIEDPLTDDGSFFSRRWTGYFRPLETGTYTFYMSSDDASYMWLGQPAVSGWSALNAVINNGGLHGYNEVQSSPINLQAGQYYPIQVLFGENGGGDALSLSYSTATTSKTTDLTNLIFYNPNAGDGRGI